MTKPPSIKFLVDEDVEHGIIEFLREERFDTVAVTETFPSVPDTYVLAEANRQGRTLLTNDKDFGELVFKEGKASYGVVLIRMPFFEVEEKIVRLKQTLESKSNKLSKLFTVITAKRTRSEPLPLPQLP